eukprot:6564227-Heterocapsa_arctica.AAC.1
MEESGVFLNSTQLDNVMILKHELQLQGEYQQQDARRHTNFFIWLQGDHSCVKGPSEEHAGEVCRNGMNNLGVDVGDHYHSWMKVQDLLDSTGSWGLMRACETPLLMIRAMNCQVHTNTL